jgi:cell division protein FtsQ
MDGGGRLTQPLKRSRAARPAGSAARAWLSNLAELPSSIRRLHRRWSSRIQGFRLPRRAGLWATGLLFAGTLIYGAIKGGHLPEITTQLRASRDAAANAAGFRIARVAIEGRHTLSEADVLTAAGVTPRDSLLFLDLEAARARLLTSAWIADATLRKLYPGELQIAITERTPFAIWQKAGALFVIAADGTVLAPLTDRRLATLPLVVGTGAEIKAQAFLSVLAPCRNPHRRSALDHAAQERDRCAAARHEARGGTRHPDGA